MFTILGLGFISGLAASLSGWGYAQLRWREARYIEELKRERKEFEEFANNNNGGV